MLSVYKKFAGQTAIYGGGYVLIRILNYLLVSTYLVNKLDSEFHYGLYNEIYTYIGIFLILLLMRMDTTFFRFGQQKEERQLALGSALALLAAVSGITSAVVYGFAHPIAHALGHPDYAHLVRYAALIIFLDVMMAIPFANLRLEERPLRFSILKILQIGLFILWILVVLEVLPRSSESFADSLDNDKILQLVFSGNVITSGLTLAILLPQSLRLVKLPNWSLIDRMLRYGWPLILVAVFIYGISNGYVLTLKYLLPGDVIENTGRQGLYAVVFKLALIMQIFTTAYNYAAEPFFFQQKDRNDASTVYANVALGYVLVSLVLIFGALLGAELFFDLGIYSEVYREHMHLLPWLMLSLLLQGIYYNVSAWYKIKDKTLMGAFMAASGLAVYLLFSVVMIPKIGETAAVFSTLTAYMLMLVLNHFLKKGKLDVTYDYLKMGIYFGLMMALFWLHEEVIRYLSPGYLVKYALKLLFLLVFASVVYFVELRPRLRTAS